MKVMQLVLSLVIGGTERLIYDIVRRGNHHGVSSVVCCLDELGAFGEELRQEGYPVYALKRTPGIDWGLIRKLNAIIAKEQVAVIHAHQYTPYFYGVLTTVFRKFTFCQNVPKLIFTEHGRFYPDRRKLKRVIANPILSLFTDEIVTISESTKLSLITYENFPPRRIRVIYNGVELAPFLQASDPAATKHALHLSPDFQVIGIVARLDPIKNHALLLRAFAQVLEQQPATYLLIIGAGAEEVRLKELARSLALLDKTVFLGARRDIPELLHICDVFALSSFSEGTSVTLIEAMGAGVPIVATRVGGNPEVVEEGECGYLVRSDNAQEMATMLLKLLGDQALRQRLGKAGRQRAATLFSLDKMVTAYTELYFKLAGGRGSHENT